MNVSFTRRAFLSLIVLLSSTLTAMSLDDQHHQVPHYAYNGVQEQRPYIKPFNPQEESQRPIQSQYQDYNSFIIKPVDRNWELIEALRHGIQSVASFLGMLYAGSKAAYYFRDDKMDSLNCSINILMALAMADITFRKAALSSEAFRRTILGYVEVNPATKESYKNLLSRLAKNP